jgi:hypothetical protein
MREVIKNTKIIDWIVAIVVLFSLMVYIVHLGKKDQVKYCQSEAVKVGVAKWDSDINGEPKFTWITNNVNIQ